MLAVSPAGEVDLITPQVNVGVGEHDADLLEELLHEFICSVQNGIYWPEGARWFGAGVTRCEQIRLTWEGGKKSEAGAIIFS